MSIFGILSRVIAWLLTVASLIGFAYALKPPGRGFDGGARWILVAAITLCFVDFGVRITDFRRERRSSPKLYRPGRNQAAQIRTFMSEWIASGSHVAIFTRDLSWVDPEVKELLTTKARDSELTLVLPKSTELGRQLAADGAEVITYPGLDYVIRSRFTIQRLDRNDSAVAIGHTGPDGHAIEIFPPGNHPSHHLATDLIQVMRRVGQQI